MSRFGDGIYDSDSNLDFLSEIERFVLKEAAYWFAPEQVERYSDSKTRWLREGVTLLEILNIFAETHEDHFGWPTFLDGQETAIERWEEVFFTVWDAEWNEDQFLYSTWVYRVEKRIAVKALFERLSKFADFWHNDLEKHGLLSMQKEPPLFLITCFDTQDDRNSFMVGECFHDLVEKLIHHIVFILSDENQNKERGFHINELEEVMVSIDIIGLLGETYQMSPGLRPQTVQRWLDTLIGLWINFESERLKEPFDVQILVEKEGLLYTNAVNAFVRLMNVAQRYPGWIRL